MEKHLEQVQLKPQNCMKKKTPNSKTYKFLNGEKENINVDV